MKTSPAAARRKGIAIAAIATALFAGLCLSMSGPRPARKTQAPPMPATSPFTNTP